VRSDDLNDRANVADLAVVAIPAFERLHLRRYNLPNLGLIKCHSVLLLAVVGPRSALTDTTKDFQIIADMLDIRVH
jgi:hypothetical protein